MVATPCMIIIDVYFGKSKIYCDVRLKVAFVLTYWPLKLTLGHSILFRDFDAHMWLETWDILHTRNAGWLAC